MSTNQVYIHVPQVFTLYYQNPITNQTKPIWLNSIFLFLFFSWNHKSSKFAAIFEQAVCSLLQSCLFWAYIEKKKCKFHAQNRILKKLTNSKWTLSWENIFNGYTCTLHGLIIKTRRGRSCREVRQCSENVAAVLFNAFDWMNGTNCLRISGSPHWKPKAQLWIKWNPSNRLKTEVLPAGARCSCWPAAVRFPTTMEPFNKSSRVLHPIQFVQWKKGKWSLTFSNTYLGVHG